MQIVDFTAAHIEQAMQVAMQNYEMERRFVPALQSVDVLPDMMPFAKNGLGVAAFDGATMLGFLCCVSPFNNAFRSTDATGVFSPVYANGAVGDNRSNAYARMYQAAVKKWAGAGASSHAICLYAHDKESQEQFFRYGFGLRCIDAIREMEEINALPCPGYSFYELSSGELSRLLPLDHLLDAHMAASPSFILRPSQTEESFVEKAMLSDAVFFVAEHSGQIVAFIRAEQDGETFVCDMPGYLHMTGAYCLTEHRGKGLQQALLNTLIQKLKNQGYTHLGVDFESINPAAYGFWLKYFSAYTHSVVRRIDEHAITK